jgi:hypothetical protein
MSNMQQWSESQANPEVVVNENFVSGEHQVVYAKDPDSTTALTWGYLGGRWGGFSITAGTVTLTGEGSPTPTHYVVVNRSTGAVSVSTNATNWNNVVQYARVYKIYTNASAVLSTPAPEDHRAGPGGVHGQQPKVIVVACSDEGTELTASVPAVTFRMPFPMTLTAVRASLSTAASGSPTATVQADINESGSTILSTKLTIDHGEKTSTTAAVPAVISDSSLADDAEITIDIDVGGGGAKGLKVTLIGL